MFEIYWGDRLVAFNSMLNMPSGTIKNAFREHRLVVLPDFQGLGFGTKISEFMGQYLVDDGCKYFSRSTHIRLGRHREASNLWIPTATNQKLRSTLNDDNKGTTQGKKYKTLDDKRVAYSFEYVGENYTQKPHQLILCSGECVKSVAESLLGKIIDTNKYPIIASGIASNKTITVWEEIAKERGYRTEVLLIKRKEEYNLNNKILSQGVDCVLVGDDAKLKLEKIKINVNNYILG